MSEFNWGNYAWAYKAIHDKLNEILAKLDNVSDPQLVEAILAKEVHIANIAGLLINAGFEFGDFTGWLVNPNNANILTDPVHTGTYSCEILANREINKYLVTPADVDRIRSLGIWCWFSVVAETRKLRIYAYYSDDSSDSHNFTLDPNTWTFCDLQPYLTSGKKVQRIRYKNMDRDYECNLDDAEFDVETETLLIRGAVLSGQTTVAEAGTPVVLGSGLLKHSVLIQPMPTNTGNVFVGNSSGQHFVLTPTSEPIRVFAKDLGDIYIDAANNGEGVNYLGG